MMREEIAKRHESLIEEGSEAENLRPIKAKLSPNSSTVFSTRYTRDELARIEKAAEERGMSVSGFIRAAALAAAEGESNLDESAVRQVRRTMRELAQAVDRL